MGGISQWAVHVHKGKGSKILKYVCIVISIFVKSNVMFDNFDFTDINGPKAGGSPDQNQSALDEEACHETGKMGSIS